MTTSPDSELPGAESDQPRLSRLTPVVANRAMLLYLVAASLVQLLLVAGLHTGVGVALLGGGIATLLLLLVFFPGALRELRQTPRWRTRPDVLTALGAFGLGFVASRAFAVFVQAVLPGAGEALQNYNLQLTSSNADQIVLLLAGGLFIPFVEELIFRGLGLTSYERFRPALTAALLTSLLFAVAHQVPAQVAAVLPLGYVIARSVQFSGSFWTGVLIHAANNTLSLGALALLSRVPEFESMVRTSGSNRISLGLGLAGLVVAAVTLLIASNWLRPRDAGGWERGPVWSWSLSVPLLLMALVASGESLSQHLRPALDYLRGLFVQ